MSDKPSSVRFYYEKAHSFRVVHVDGVIGGLTPTRDIFVAVYNQRSALPKEIEQSVTPEGKLGTELAREGKTGIFREMETGLVMSPTVAKDMAEWLLRQVKILEESDRAVSQHRTI